MSIDAQYLTEDASRLSHIRERDRSLSWQISLLATSLRFPAAEGAKELDPQDPESYNTAREYGLDVDKVLSLIESVRQKQGEMPAAGSQEELREKEKLLKMAQNLHLWMETDDPIAKDVYGNRKA